jgi:GntR family transcriptional regulator of vanillate catabolism
MEVQSEQHPPGPGDDAVTSADQAALQLRELILEGTLEPGAPLRQEDLARQLGVSRTPLRTALATLSRDGLVDYAANRGYRVRRFVIGDVVAAFEARAALEAEACRLAGRRDHPEHFHAGLAEAIATGDAILSGGSLQPALLADYRRMNVGFHGAILDASGNRWLSEFVRRTHEVPMASDRIILWEDYAIIRRSHDDHHRIAKALRAGDGERAGRIMHEHVIFAGEVLVRHLNSLVAAQDSGSSSFPRIDRSLSQ